MIATGPTHTLNDLATAALAPGVPQALMPGRAVDVVPAVVGRLDGAITDFFGFEVHLGRAEAQVDTLVCVKAATGGRERLAASLVPAAGEPWRQDLQTFLAAWAAPGTPWSERVENVWLEFDLVAPQLPQPAPSLFFGAHRLVGADEPELLRELLRASAVLRGGALGSATLDLARHVLRLLPPQAAIFQIGQMMARPGAPLRLCLRGIPGSAIAGYLAELGYSDRRRDIEELVAAILDFGGEIDVDLDLGDRLGERIGFEWRPRAEPAERVAGEAGMFAWLTQQGWCRPDKALACRAWSRLAHCRRHREVWPETLFGGDGDPQRSATSCIVRYLHHVKVVAGPGGAREAKAYLACLHRFIPDREIKELLRAAEATSAPAQAHA